MASQRRFRSPGLPALDDRFVGDDPVRVASYERALAEEMAVMAVEKRTALEAAGFRFGDAADFLELTEDERMVVEGLATVNPIERLRDGVRVHDAFDSKASYNLDYPPGVVAVLEGFASRGPGRFIGKAVRIVTGSGTPIRATIDDARDHGTTISFFFKGLSKRDVPIGSIVSLEDRPGR